MFGFGIGELMLVVLVLGLSITSLLGFDALKKGLGRKEDKGFEQRVLDELDVIRFRLDVMNQRLDQAGIQRPGDDPLFPSGPTEGRSE